MEKAQVWKKYFDNNCEVNCPNCDYEKITPFKFEMSHIIAHANNGSSNLDNIIPLCTPCNRHIGKNEVDIKKCKKNIYKYQEKISFLS